MCIRYCYQICWPDCSLCHYIFTSFQSFILEPGFFDSGEAWDTIVFLQTRGRQRTWGQGSVPGRHHSVLLGYMLRVWGIETSLNGQDNESTTMLTCTALTSFRGSPLPNFPRPFRWSFLLKADFFPLCVLFFIHISSHSFPLSAHYSLIIPSFSLMHLSFPISVSSFCFLHSQSTSFFSSYYLDTSYLLMSFFFLISLPWHVSCMHNTHGTWGIWDKMTWVPHKPSCSTKLNTEAGSRHLLVTSISNWKDCWWSSRFTV